MDEQRTTQTGKRSTIIFAVVGLILVGLLFGAVQLIRVRNDQVAMTINNNQPEQGQNEPQQDPQPQTPSPQTGQTQQQAERQQAQQAEREKIEREQQAARDKAEADRREQTAVAERERVQREQSQASQAQNATPPQVARTGPADQVLPSTGPAEDYALTAVFLTLAGFGLYRLRQSKSAVKRSSLA